MMMMKTRSSRTKRIGRGDLMKKKKPPVVIILR